MSALPAWANEGLKYLGQREIKGVQHSGWILSLWRAIRRGGIKDDETPWCAAFVGAMLEAVGIQSTRFEGARSYLDYGTWLAEPLPGCIAVLERPGGWHVGFVLGHAATVTGGAALALLGGNQGDAVSVMNISTTAVRAFRWPPGQPKPAVGLGAWAGGKAAGSMS